MKISTDSIEVEHKFATGKSENYFFTGCSKADFFMYKRAFFCFLLIIVAKLIIGQYI